MKILFLSPGCFDKGGISRYNRYQIKALQIIFGRGNVKVISLLGPDEHSFEDNYPVHWHGHGTSLKDKWRFMKNATSLCLNWKPQVIHIGHVNLSGFAFMLSKAISAKTVLNVYGLEIWSGLSVDASFGLRNVNYIISDCHNTADYLLQHKLRKRETMDVIWDCIDTERFSPGNSYHDSLLAKYNIPDPRTHFNILSLGRLSKPDAFYKGYDRLIKAFHKVHPSHPNTRLVIAGRGNYTEELKGQTNDLGLDSVVSFTGSIDEKDLVAVYQACSLFSLVTEAGKGKGEGIPLTPLEAMACGKPILVGNQDGSREAVVNGENGNVLDPANLNSHAEVILSYLDNEAMLVSKSENAARIAKQFFSFDEFLSKHRDFVSKYLSN